MRDLTANVESELAQASLRPFIAAELDFESGFVRLWNGFNTISFGGSSFIGGGTLVGIDPIAESSETKSIRYAMSLSGIPSPLLATTLAENYQGRAAKIWVGFLNAQGSVIADPVLMVQAHIDTMEIIEGPETSTITLTVETALTDTRARISRFTHQEQVRRYYGDTGLSRVAKLVDKSVFWGARR